MSAYPGILRACTLIALDNGGINRNRSKEAMEAEFETWIADQMPDALPAINAWLSNLSDDNLDILCCGEAGDLSYILDNAPPLTSELLNRYFDEVC